MITHRHKLTAEFYLRRMCAGAASLVFKPSDVASISGLSSCQLYYWRQKATDDKFHPNPWGGPRSHKYTPEQQMAIESTVWSIVSNNPSLRIIEICLEVEKQTGLEIKQTWLKDLFKSWRWYVLIIHHT